MNLKTLFLLCIFSICHTNEIPLEVKLEYSAKMNEGFFWQAAGHSTVAFATFDQGYEKAAKE